MLSFILLASLGAGPLPYAEAIRQAEETERPLVILIGAKWCPACVKMRDQVMAPAVSSGLAAGAIYCYLDYDEQAKVAKELVKGYDNLIPQVVIFRNTDIGWRRPNNIVGATSWAAIAHRIKSTYIPNHVARQP